MVYPTDKAAYGRMCRLLSVGKGRAGKGACHLEWSDVAEWNEGLLAMLVPDRADAVSEAAAGADRSACSAIAPIWRLPSGGGRRTQFACAICRRSRPPQACRPSPPTTSFITRPNVGCCRMWSPASGRKCTIDTLGAARERFADRYLKTGEEMERLFRRYLKDTRPVARSVEFAARCTFSLDELKYQYPDEIQVRAAPRNRSSNG